MWVFLCNSIYPQTTFAFLSGSSVAGTDSRRVKDLREVFMTFSEDQLKRIEAFIIDLYHAHYSLQNLLHQRAQRLFLRIPSVDGLCCVL
jgi:hypothetical protein